ncbi:unnamed protein product, partial [marine sediment metagenome]
DKEDTTYQYEWLLDYNDDYEWSYAWTLKDFMQKGFEKFKDGDIAQKNYLRKDKK